MPTFKDMMGKTKSMVKPKGHNKVEKVMSEWKAGTLRSSSGQLVTDRSQALAIALSEQREYDKKKQP